MSISSRLRLQACSLLLLGFAMMVPEVNANAQNVQFLPGATILAGNGTKGYTGDGGLAVNATLANAALAVTTDPQGNVFIADSGNNAIRRVDAGTGIITTYAGLAPGATICAAKADAIGDGCPATQASLNAPSGLRFYNGDLYIADTNNDYIRVVNSATGIISVFAGNGAASGVVFGTGPGAAKATALGLPTDLIFDTSGNVYIITGNGKPYVLRVDHVTGNVTNVAGNGTAASTGDGGLATSASIQTPTGLALDSANNLYISETGQNAVRVVNLTSGIINTVAGQTNVACATSTAACGDGGLATLAQLNGPDHMIVDTANNLYIVDQKDHRIRVVNALTGIITTLVGTGTPSNSPSGTVEFNVNLNNPRGIDWTPAGDIIYTDGFNAEVKILTPPDNAPSSFGSTAVGSTLGAQNTWLRVNAGLTVSATTAYGIPAAYKDFTNTAPVGCAAGAVETAGSTCDAAVTFTPKVAGFQGAPMELIDSAGNVYAEPLAGIGNAPAAAVLPGIVSATAGSTTGASGNAGDGSAATAALLNGPTAVAFDSLGNYYVADTANNEVRMISLATGVITRIAGNGTACGALPGGCGDGGAATSAMLNGPRGIAVDGAGQVYIADTGDNRVRMVNASGVISTVAGNGTAGYTGDGAAATAAELRGPQGIYLTPSGSLYIADTGNNAVRVLATRSGFISTLAGTGVSGYSGDGRESQLSQLNAPASVVVDNADNTYIADTGNHLIRRVTANVVTTYAGANTVGDSDGSAASALFSSPGAMAVDAGGSVYIADAGNNSIRRIANGQVSTVAGTGAAGNSGNGASSTSALVKAPAGVGLDSSGNLVIADTGNNAVRTVSVSAAALAFPTTSPNVASSPMAVSLLDSGNQPLSVAGITLPANFAEQASGGTDCNASGLSLAAGAVCQASLVFTPTAAQSYSGTATLTDNSQAVAGTTQTIALTGTGAYVFTAKITAAAPQVVAGQAFSVTVSVTNPAATYAGTIHFTTTDKSSAAVLPPDYSFSAHNNTSGTATFAGVVLATSGQQTITITDTANPALTASVSVTVTGGAVSKLVIVSGNSQSANINTNYAQPLSVEALDSYGNAAAAGTSVVFTAPLTGATVTFNKLSSYTGVTNVQGIVSSPTMLADGVTGTFAVTAASAGATGVSFSLTNTSTVAAGFTLSSNPAAINGIAPGTSGSAVVTITPVGGFNAPVNVSCGTVVATASCSVTPATVQPSGLGTPVSFTVTVSTTGPATGALRSVDAVSYASLCVLTGAAAFFRRRRLRTVVLAMMCGVALLGLGGCGSAKPAQTTVGSYSLTITATSGAITNSLVIPYYISGAP